MINITGPLSAKNRSQSCLHDMWAEFFSALSITALSVSLPRQLAGLASLGSKRDPDAAVSLATYSWPPPLLLAEHTVTSPGVGSVAGRGRASANALRRLDSNCDFEQGASTGPVPPTLFAPARLSCSHSLHRLSSPFCTDLGEQRYFWLPKEQVWIVINALQDWAGSLTVPKAVADETGFPVACVLGEPQPGKYSIFLKPPSLNRQLYPKLTRAVFAEGRRSKRTLWLIEGARQIKFCKIFHMAQLTGARPDIDSDWLAAAFEYVSEMDLNGAFGDQMQTTWP